MPHVTETVSAVRMYITRCAVWTEFYTIPLVMLAVRQKTREIKRFGLL